MWGCVLFMGVWVCVSVWFIRDIFKGLFGLKSLVWSGIFIIVEGLSIV